MNNVNWEHLKLIYKRINDLELRFNEIEKYKLQELYQIEKHLLLGGELTERDILRQKLTKYMKESVKNKFSSIT